MQRFLLGLVMPLSALLFSVVILLLGHGLQLTLLPIYAVRLGWPADWVGYTASAYYVGFILGCMTMPRTVAAVGHIRVFAVVCAGAGASVLLMGLFSHFPVWMAVRFVNGWALAGMYMVVESWLNQNTQASHRGVVLSLYAMVSMVGLCAGQGVLAMVGGSNLKDVFMLSAVFLMLAIVPVGLTRTVVPAPPPAVKFSMGKVYRISHIAAAGAYIGGLVTSAFWAFGPLFAGNLGWSVGQISAFMSAGILGGAVLQLPLGRVSDRMDRRKVILMLAVVGGVSVCLVMAACRFHPAWLYAPIFMFGASAFPLYALSAAHANDNTEMSKIEISSSMLLLNGAGCISGPLLVGPLMKLWGDWVLFASLGVVYVIFAAWTVERLISLKVNREHFEPFADIPKTTQGVLLLAPEEKRAPQPSDSTGG